MDLELALAQARKYAEELPDTYEREITNDRADVVGLRSLGVAA